MSKTRNKFSPEIRERATHNLEGYYDFYTTPLSSLAYAQNIDSSGRH